MFAIANGIVSYSSDRPGDYASMFGPDGEKLSYRSDASHFNDKARQYTWSFQISREVREGDVFVFATRDREAVGLVESDKITVTRKWRAFINRYNSIEPKSVTLREIESAPVKRLVTLKGAERQLPSASLRCMFVNPSVPYGQWACYKQGTMNEASFSAHGAAYVSATLKAEGHHCFMVDLRSMNNWKHVEDVLRDQVFDVAFVGFLSIDVFNAAGVVRLLKELHPNKPVVVGGLHVSIAKESVFPREDLLEYYCFGNHGLLPDVFQQFLGYKGESCYDPTHFPIADYVILDDGEIAARDLVAAISSGKMPEERTIEGGAVPMEVARHLDRDLFRLDVEAYSPILPFQPTPMVTVTWARGCPFHCTYSVTGDTLVFTDDGPVEIAELTKGIGLVRQCVHGASFMEHRVDLSVSTPAGQSVATRALDEGVQPVLQVTVEGGLKVKATPEHRFLCAVDEVIVWKRADELKVDDFMVVRQPERKWPLGYVRLTPPTVAGYITERHKCPDVLDEKLAWLAGFIVGDGCLARDGRAVVSICVPPNAIKHQEIVKALFDTELHIYPFDHTDKQFQGQIHSRHVREIFTQSLGLDPNDKLKIPAIFWKSPKTVLAAFLEGLYEADGYQSDSNGHYLTTVSEHLARDVAFALLMLGRGCPSIQYVVPSNDDGVDRQSHYRVSILRNDRIPSVRSIYKSRKSGVWYWRTKKSQSRIGIRRRTLRESGLNHPLDRDGWYYVKVRSIENCAPEAVYDITVPGEEAFVANGFVAHNCNLSSQLSNTNVRTKPTALVEEELDDLHRRFNSHVGSLMIHDDLTFHPRAIAGWCELIIEKYGSIPLWLQTRAPMVIKWYTKDRPFWDLLCRAGLTWASIGYESGSQRVLDYMKKDSTVEENVECARILDEYGINSFANLLWGVPSEDNGEADATVALARKIRPGFLSGSIYTSYPGTAQDKECRAKGMIVEGEVYTRSHLPWQYRIKGIDYPHLYDCLRQASEVSSYLRMPKMLPEDRKRELAGTSRGLPIH